MGTYKLKGVAGEQTVMQINGLKFSNRVFPKKAASSKAEIVIDPSPPPPCSAQPAHNGTALGMPLSPDRIIHGPCG